MSCRDVRAGINLKGLNLIEMLTFTFRAAAPRRSQPFSHIRNARVPNSYKKKLIMNKNFEMIKTQFEIVIKDSRKKCSNCFNINVGCPAWFANFSSRENPAVLNCFNWIKEPSQNCFCHKEPARPLIRSARTPTHQNPLLIFSRRGERK